MSLKVVMGLQRGTAEVYSIETGNAWQPRRDSHVLQTSKLNSVATSSSSQEKWLEV